MFSLSDGLREEVDTCFVGWAESRLFCGAIWSWVLWLCFWEI